MKHKLINIKDIAYWLFDPEKDVLPAIQRGFVWKASQIENLWDSLLRDFPIGSLLTSENGALIDGQQRATSIALGFYNPWEQTLEKIGNAKDFPIVWLDLKPQSIPSNNEYLFRAVTHSHPWGYRADKNDERLSEGDRKKSYDNLSELFKNKPYTCLDKKERRPYDASIPVPLCFLLSSIEKSFNAIEWGKRVLDNCKKIEDDYHTKHNQNNSYLKSVEDAVKGEEFKNLYEAFKRLVEYEIPVITVENDKLISNNDKGSSETDPTLFVRLNRSGTPLNGEELIYSIFKSVYPDAKKLVESIEQNVMSPSRMISLTSRLVSSINNNNDYCPKITVRDFQVRLKDESFKDGLDNMLSPVNKQKSLSEIVKKVIEILRYDGTIPDYVVKGVIAKYPDAILLMMNWLYHNPDTILDDGEKRRICRWIYSVCWFSNSNKNKNKRSNYERIVKKSWSQSSSETFWDQKFENIDSYLRLPLVSPELLRKFVKTCLEKDSLDLSLDRQENPAIWEFWKNDLPEGLDDNNLSLAISEGWNSFIDLAFSNKNLILLAQREFINENFKDFNQLANLEDTDTPWDWDHIYPKSWVENKWYIDKRTRYWEWKNGNFRAMPLAGNRSESNGLSPKARFADDSKDQSSARKKLLY